MFFFSTFAYFVNGDTYLKSDLTDNYFYSSAERIWLCIRLNNAAQNLKRRILATFGFNRTALRATQPK